MTGNEFTEWMVGLGYHGSMVQSALESHIRDSNPVISVFHRDFIGADMLNVFLDFESNGTDISFLKGRAGVFRAEVSHTFENGIDTRELEQRLQQVNWDYDHLYMLDQFPEDKQVAITSRVIVPDIYKDLNQLFNGSREGMLLAEQLCVKHIAWHHADDRNDPLIPLMCDKYYKVQHVHEVIPPMAFYNELKDKPVPDIDIGFHIHNFLERHHRIYQKLLKTPSTMNLNNLENLKEEMKALGFKDKLIAEMEKNMEKNVPEFTLYDTVPATKGQVDLTLHFKQSGQSDYYYFNKFDATLNTGKPLAEGQKYLVISPGADDKPMFRKFENPHDAIAYFKEQKGNSELAIGKDPAHKELMASMEKGKINYVKKDFQRTFSAAPVSQTFWVEKGKGFTAEEASNLIQGRAVYRDDLLNMGGMTYKAWVKLDFDKPKDRHDNFNTNQYHDPSYGFNLEKALDKFNIRELADPAQKEILEASLKSGNRPLITTVKDGQEVKLFVEAVPRYSQINFFAENGKPEKREQFLKEPALDNTVSKGKGKEKEVSESQGMKM